MPKAGLAVLMALMITTSVSAQIVVKPENRCSPYVRSHYSYPQSIELRIIDENLAGVIFSPYTGEIFLDRSETDIEHIVATSEAHDSGLCAADVAERKLFARDLDNLTLASPAVNRHQKSGKDFAEWTPAANICWFAQTIINVKARYGLSVDTNEALALLIALKECQPQQACSSTTESDWGAILNCYAGSEDTAAAEADQAETDTLGCFPYDTAYVITEMNIREEASATSDKLGVAQAGAYDVKRSAQGETYCWIDIDIGWIAQTARVSSMPQVARSVSRSVSQSVSQVETQPPAVQQQAVSSAQEPASQPATQNALALYDDNRNGRITCAEARNHGIAPVSRGHPAYQYMDDRDHDGIVCE